MDLRKFWIFYLITMTEEPEIVLLICFGKIKEGDAVLQVKWDLRRFIPDEVGENWLVIKHPGATEGVNKSWCRKIRLTYLLTPSPWKVKRIL